MSKQRRLFLVPCLFTLSLMGAPLANAASPAQTEEEGPKDPPAPKEEPKTEKKKKEGKKPASKTGIEWKVAPAHVVIWLDGKKLGVAGELTFSETKPGKHVVKLTKGGDETETDVVVQKGSPLQFEFEFTDG